MLGSTQEYLSLLRQGDIVGALEWVSFLEHSYGGKEAQITADKLLPVAIYELVNHGFCKADLPSIVILFALISEQPSLLPGTLDYSATIFLSAAMQCLVYDDLKIMDEYKQQPLINHIEKIEELVQKETDTFTAPINAKRLLEKSRELGLLALNPLFSKKIQLIKNRLLLLDLCQVYIEELMTRKENHFALRAGIVKALQGKLQKNLGSDESENLLREYVNEVRKMAPEAWEENLYLSQLAPKGVLDDFLYNTKVSLQFFIGGLFTRLIHNGDIESSKETTMEKTEQGPQL